MCLVSDAIVDLSINRNSGIQEMTMSNVESVPGAIRKGTGRAKKKISEYRPEDLRVDWTDLHFYCDWFHHMTHLPNRYCVIVYQLALKLSHESKVFDASAINIAHDLDCDEKTIRRAIELLRNTGWLVQIKRSKRPGEYIPNAYTVRDHEQWAKECVGLCGEKVDSIWAGEGERIAQFLCHHTGGAVKWREFETKKMLSYGHSDEALLELFRSYWDSVGCKEEAKQVPWDFNRFLSELAEQSRARSSTNTSTKQHEFASQNAANESTKESENSLQRLLSTAKGKLEFETADRGRLLKFQETHGNELVEQALNRWLRENDLSGRSRKGAANDFVEDLPRLLFVIEQKAGNVAAAAAFSGESGGLFSPTARTQ